jgi:hypothetical protein
MANTPSQPRDYDAEIAALVKERDVAALDLLKDVQEILNREDVAQAITDLSALLPQLPQDGSLGSPRNQAMNVVNVVNNVRDNFDREVARVQAIVDAQAQP